MLSTKPNDTSPFYRPLPSNYQSPEHLPQQSQYVIALPYHRRPRYSCLLLHRRLLCIAAVLPFLIAATYILWPSDPYLSIARLRLDGLQFHTRPKISIDIKLDLTVKVRNRNVYSIDYDSLAVAIWYRGNRLGYATSNHGCVRAHGKSYVNATLQLDGVEFLSDVILLLDDLSKGSVPFDTVTEIDGKFGFFFFNIPLKDYCLTRLKWDGEVRGLLSMIWWDDEDCGLLGMYEYWLTTSKWDGEGRVVLGKNIM